MIDMYIVIFRIIQVIRWLINGKTHVYGQENIPKNTQFILIAPHRTWWDPLWFAMTLLPRQFIIMAKKELYKNKAFGWALKKIGVFPVDRDHPGPSAIKIPVKELRSGTRNFMIFPSGSRHSSKLEGGAVLIAKMSGRSLLPVVYQGPLKFIGLFRRGSTSVAFGPMIPVPKKADEKEIIISMQKAFSDLDKKINKNWVYIDPHPKKTNQDK